MNAVAHYTSAFAGSESGLPGSAVPWLVEKRRAAMALVGKSGFPTTRDEAWRYTDVAQLLTVPFAPAKSSAAQRAVTLAENAGLADAHRLVFVDGVYIAEASRLAGLPEGVIVTNLAAALGTHPERVRAAFGKVVTDERHGFAALNTAMASDGAVVMVPRGVHIEKPIEVLVVASNQVQPVGAHLRNLLVLEASASATVVEHYMGDGNAVSFTNCVTEVMLAENASLTHVKAQREGQSAFHVATIACEQQRSSRFYSCSAAAGGALARTEITSALLGEGADAQLFGAYVARGRQHVDHTTFLDHAVAHCTSNELYKGVMGDMARGVFNGKILVRKDAQKTAAFQSNRNILLSDAAVIDTRPQLEIYADDVKCSHGATIGRLDEEALFYLRARGIDRQTAQRILTQAFAGEVVESIASPAIRALVSSVVDEALTRALHGGVS